MNNTLGETLRKIRMEKELSQQQLAEMIHVDRSTIANWERGKRLPDIDMLMKISDTLMIDISYLITASLNQNNSPNVIMIDDEGSAIFNCQRLYKAVRSTSLCKREYCISRLCGY